MNGGLRVLSSLLPSHKRIRVNINMPGNVCQAVKCEDKTQKHSKECTVTSVHPITPRSYLVWETWRGKCVLPVSGFLYGTQRAQTSVSEYTITMLFLTRQLCLRSACNVHSGKWETSLLQTLTLQYIFNYISFIFHNEQIKYIVSLLQNFCRIFECMGGQFFHLVYCDICCGKPTNVFKANWGL